MNSRELLGAGIRVIGVYYFAQAMMSAVFALGHLVGVDMGATSNVRRDLVFCGGELLVSVSLLASAKELAAIAYKGKNYDAG